MGESVVQVELWASSEASESGLATALRSLGCGIEPPGSGEDYCVVLHDLRQEPACPAEVVARIESDARPTVLVTSSVRPELAELAARAPHVVLISAAGCPESGLAVALHICSARQAVLN